MPTSSSSSAGETKPRTRRASSAKAKPKTSRTRAKKAEAEDVSAEDGSESTFGDGVDDVETPRPRRRRAAKKKPVESAADENSASETKTESADASDRKASADSDTSSVSEGRREQDTKSRDGDVSANSDGDDDRPNREAEASSETRGNSDAEGSDQGAGGDQPSGGDEGNGNGDDDGDRRPRRRRRRRRRGGESGGGDSRGGQNSGGQQRGGGRGRGGQDRGGRGQQDRGGRGPDRGGRGPDRGVRGGSAMRRGRQVQVSGEDVEGTFEGVLELHPTKGYGFLRNPKKNYAAEDSNPFVSSSVVEKFALREGVLIRGDVGPGTRNQGPRLREVELIDGYTPEEYLNVKHFDDLTPINPFEQIKLETGARPITMRVMDLLCPIGKGQRALLVAPPRTGKTMLLQDIANAVTENHPEIHLMVLLIDERPEEVTEMQRTVKGEVIASSLDQDVESHVRIAQLIIERGKRLAESGKDVFILLDSITRLARAFNKWVTNSGRTGRGGLDIRALDMPKKLFGTARRFDEGGSLTVCGTALIETNNGMDEAIFQEFKGTGNMEMVLSRDLADRRIWPSIDIGKSGTRREEKILDPEVLEGATLLRRSLVSLNSVEAMEQLTKTMEKFPTNSEFLSRIRNIL